MGLALRIAVILAGTMRSASPVAVVDASAGSPGMVALDGLHDITGIERNSRPSSSPRWPTWAVVGALAFMAVALLAWSLRGGPRPRPRRPDPAEQLEALVRHPPDARTFHLRLAEIVRGQAQERLGLPPSLSTEELVQQAAGVLAEEAAAALRKALGRCDLAKFAGTAYSAADCEESMEAAQRFVKAAGAGQSAHRATGMGAKSLPTRPG